MSQKTLREVLKESKEGRKILKKYNSSLDDYEKSEADNTLNNNNKNKEIAEKISKLMMKDPRVNHELKDKLPITHNLKKNKLKNLRLTAQGDGSWKVKRAAQKKLDNIRDAREKNVNSGYKSIEKTSYSEGRKGSKGWISNKISDKLLGFERYRTAAVTTPNEATEIDYSYNLKNGKKAHLHGYMFEPKGESNGKVVLVYSGSGAPAGVYINNIADPYRKAGCRVVVMDYRGFGKSKTEDKDGNKIDFQLGERSMYQDGEAMLSYVQKNLGYSNSNIILHGYSLGGAVASKVAANMAERNAVKRKDGKLAKEKDRLGGLVLHSAMGSNYKTSRNFFKDDGSNKVIAAGAGFLSWLLAGSFNTISHMKRLHNYDPKLRVHLVSGCLADDHLHIVKSGIKANNPYTTATTYVTEAGHKSANIREEDQGLQNLIQSDRVKDHLINHKKNMNEMQL